MANGRIFESRTYALDAEMRSDEDTLVVFFPHRWATRRGMYRAYGADFAEKYGLNALLVRSVGPSWFQADDFCALAEAIGQAARLFDRVILTGSSMGGYGAIRVAEHVAADEVIAFSPISNIDPDIWPHERGFVGDLDPGRRFHRVTRHRAAHYSVFYDPLHLDRLHMQAFGIPAQRLRSVPVLGAGHKTTDLLAEAGMLSRITRALIAGQPIDPLLAETRRAKRSTSAYLLALYHRNIERRPAVAARALGAMMARGHHADRIPRMLRRLPPDFARAVVTEAA